MITAEGPFQKHVLELAAWTGWSLRYHTHDSRRSHQGFPDLVLVRPPRVIFAELKGDTPYGKKGPSPDQQAWIDGLGRCPGVEVYLWRPADLDEILRVLSHDYSPAP